VAKVDFKRAADERLWLLEVNPRFNLWHHPGAVAGVNLPALVWADLTGQPRPPAGRARPCVRWCDPWEDAAASKAAGSLGLRWAVWALGCEAKSGFAWDDPMPFLRGVLAPKVARRLRRSAARAAARWRPRQPLDSAAHAPRSDHRSDANAA
jgi:D-aspartate ligase